MAKLQIERLDFAGRSRMTYLRMDREAEPCFDAGFYFEFSERCRRMAAAIARTVANVIRPSDQFFGSYPTAASFTPANMRFAWVGVIAGITGLAALLFLGWSEIRGAEQSQRSWVIIGNFDDRQSCWLVASWAAMKPPMFCCSGSRGSQNSNAAAWTSPGDEARNGPRPVAVIRRIRGSS